MSHLRILGICGSLRRNSYNHMALSVAGQLMPESMVLTVATIADVPLYCKDVEDVGLPPAVAQLRDELMNADAILIASPEYNFSVSGVLKNTIDWLSRCQPQPLKDKPVAILSATQGPLGGARNQYDLRKILGCLEAIVMPKPEVFIGTCHTKFDAQGQLIDETSRRIISDQQHAFERWIKRVNAPAT